MIMMNYKISLLDLEKLILFSHWTNSFPYLYMDKIKLFSFTFEANIIN